MAKHAKLHTLGVVNTYLEFDTAKIPHNLHVLNKNFNITMDGIIGNDFLIKNIAIINYTNKTITIEISNKDLYEKQNLEIFKPTNERKFISKFYFEPIQQQQKLEENHFNYYNAIEDYLTYETKNIQILKINKKNKKQ